MPFYMEDEGAQLACGIRYLVLCSKSIFRIQYVPAECPSENTCTNNQHSTGFVFYT